MAARLDALESREAQAAHESATTETPDVGPPISPQRRHWREHVCLLDYFSLEGMMRPVVADIADRARNKKLTPDDVQGGTFTITNPGGYGTFHGTPVINQPQAAILGTYAVVKRAWVIQDDMGEDVIAIRPIMNLTLTYDHRLVDGALAGRFLRDLREKLETWDESTY